MRRVPVHGVLAFVAIFFAATALPLYAQSVSDPELYLEQMRKDREAIEKKIADSQKLLTATESNIASQLAELNIVTARLEERRKLLQQTRRELSAMKQQSDRLEKQLSQLIIEYSRCQSDYADACRFFQKQQTSLSPLLFLLSSENYDQLVRRARYIHEYSTSLSEMASVISAKQQEIKAQQEEIESLRVAKEALQQQQIENEKEARAEEAAQRALLTKLQNKKSSIKSEIKNYQAKMTALNKEIDKQIQLVMKAEEERRQAAQANAGKKTDQKGNTSSTMNLPQEDVALNGSFESNKGKLPVPVTGPYLVVSGFGVQSVAGMKDVKLNNLGIDIQGETGASAKCIFDGEVSAVFQQGKGLLGILVRHGSYISVYCNIGVASVKKGDKVTLGQALGTVSADEQGRTLLHFQLHKQSQKLNPADWVKL